MTSSIPPARICLWYDHNAQDAAAFYAQIFPNSAVDAATMPMQKIDIAAIEAARRG
jgi:3-demethylubiquinone-9 3-methyltransferase